MWTQGWAAVAERREHDDQRKSPTNYNAKTYYQFAATWTAETTTISNFSPPTLTATIDNFDEALVKILIPLRTFNPVTWCGFHCGSNRQHSLSTKQSKKKLENLAL